MSDLAELAELRQRVAKLERLLGLEAAEPAKAPWVPRAHQRINPLDRVSMSPETLREFAAAVPGDLRGAAEARALGNVHQPRGQIVRDPAVRDPVGGSGGSGSGWAEQKPLRKHGDSWADALIDRALPAQGG